METIAIDDTERVGADRGFDCRKLSAPLGATDVAINRYRLGPGEGFPGGLHAHLDQEEIFVVLEGTLAFETFIPRDGPDGTGEIGEVVVGAGEAVRFAPGEFQSGRTATDREAVVLALGAPRDGEDVRVSLPCPSCGHEEVRPAVAEDGDGPVLRCPACGAESEASCPECDRGEMYATIPDDRAEPVGVCRVCGAETETA